MESFVTYAFYTDTYKGTKIPSTSFSQYGLRASYKVNEQIMNRDYTTFNSVDNTVNVQMATCSVADILYDEDASLSSTSNGTLTSEKIGDYSRSFDNQDNLTKNTNLKIKRELSMYLGLTGLLNRSIDCVQSRINYY